jgi:Prokaryotic acetaldehyde dehydrogenase, dimerisation/Sterol carrier protein domain
MGCATSTEGIDAVTGSDIDVVFDASNAAAHPTHWTELAFAGVLLVDLTPSGRGTMIAPTVNGHRAESARHLSLVSCAGQAVLPVLDVVAKHCTPAYVEVVTTVAGASAGRATRCNLDEYVATTEYAVRRLTHAPDAKVLTTWMLRVLDLGQAVRLRGWPDDLDVTIPLDVTTDTDGTTERSTLRITAGKGELTPSACDGRLRLTRRQFAVWYAGGYRNATAATLAGVRGDPQEVARLVLATSDREPWLPEHF